MPILLVDCHLLLRGKRKLHTEAIFSRAEVELLVIVILAFDTVANSAPIYSERTFINAVNTIDPSPEIIEVKYSRLRSQSMISDLFTLNSIMTH